MAQNSPFKNSWSLIAFAREFGPKVQVGNFTHVDEETGKAESFKSCIFTNKDGERKFVGFSSNMGVLTPSEIGRMKNSLQVVQLPSGSYKLCKQGDSWEDVDLGI